MKKVGISLVVLVLGIVLLTLALRTTPSVDVPVDTSSPSRISAESSAKCKNLRIAEESLAQAVRAMYDEWEAMRDQYDEEYWEDFDYDYWTQEFITSYWTGFWNSHQYCKICQANGDVPEDFAKETEGTEVN